MEWLVWECGIRCGWWFGRALDPARGGGGASKTQNQPFGAWFGAHCGLRGSLNLLQVCRDPPAGTYRVGELGVSVGGRGVGWLYSPGDLTHPSSLSIPSNLFSFHHPQLLCPSKRPTCGPCGA